MSTNSLPSPVIVAIDLGTSSTKTIVVDAVGHIVSRATVRISRFDPKPGGVGPSNQRESAVVWDRATGEALGPLLGWQDRRTAGRAKKFDDLGWSDLVR